MGPKVYRVRNGSERFRTIYKAVCVESYISIIDHYHILDYVTFLAMINYDKLIVDL